MEASPRAACKGYEHHLDTCGRIPVLEMDSFDLVVLNGVVVTASDVAEYDIAIKDEKVALLAPKGLLANVKAGRVIDAQGGYVMVGSPSGTN